jgi:hypothetical protein
MESRKGVGPFYEERDQAFYEGLKKTEAKKKELDRTAEIRRAQPEEEERGIFEKRYPLLKE